MRIALLDLRQDAGDVRHGYKDSQPTEGMTENAEDRSWGAPKSVSERVSENVGMMRRADARFHRPTSKILPFAEYGWVFGARFERQKTVQYLRPTRRPLMGRSTKIRRR